jgi:ribosomal protein S12 methylthiotransferase accessory factor
MSAPTAPAPVAPLRLQDVPPSDPMETIRKGRRLLSHKVGILRDLGSGVYYPGDPRSFVMGNHSTDPARLGAGVGYLRDRSGSAGLTLERALAASIGESAERYCMRFYGSEHLVFGSYDDLKHEYRLVHPDLARLHNEAQILAKGGPKSPGGYGRVTVFTTSSKVKWTWGYSLTAKKWTLVPAFLVYLPYKTSPGEERTGWNSSTGLAAGNTLEEAILSGIYEWVERDAFITCWLNRFVPREITVDLPETQTLLDTRYQIKHPKVQLKIFDTMLDIQIPSSFVWMIRPIEFGAVTFVGAASRLRPAAAVEKALVELAQCVPYCRYNLTRMADWTPKPDFSDVRSFEEHSVLYLKRFDLVDEAFKFCRDVDRQVGLSEIPDRSTGSVLGDINVCVEEIARHGYEVVVVDITTPDVREAGLRVVRVVVPGLANMHGNHNWPCLAVQRLYDIPIKLGWDRFGWDASAGLNPLPHPFP